MVNASLDVITENFEKIKSNFDSASLHFVNLHHHFLYVTGFTGCLSSIFNLIYVDLFAVGFDKLFGNFYLRFTCPKRVDSKVGGLWSKWTVCKTGRPRNPKPDGFPQKYSLFDILKIEFCIVTSINFTETIHIGFRAYHCSSVVQTKIFNNNFFGCEIATD